MKVFYAREGDFMILNKVTLTGADDTVTDINRMIELSKKFPFVEWGILVSESNQGGHRFPSASWISQFFELIELTETQVAIHLCGQWVRDVCRGHWGVLTTEIGPALKTASRIQLNFHSYSHLINDRFVSEAKKHSDENNWQLIFQVDGVNDHLASNAYDEGLDAVPLYDKSGGAGRVPESWPTQMKGIYSGYAGGLGPDNLLYELDRIKDVANGECWVDMETKLYHRHKFDLDICERVLGIAEPLIHRTRPAADGGQSR